MIKVESRQYVENEITYELQVIRKKVGGTGRSQLKYPSAYKSCRYGCSPLRPSIRPRLSLTPHVESI